MVERCADCGFDLAGRQGRGDPDRALHDGRRRVRGRLHHAAAAASTRPARTPAACTAPTGSAATASPTRRCSAGSRAPPWRRRSKTWRPRRTSIRAAFEPRDERAFAPLGRRGGDLEGDPPRAATTSCGTMSASCAPADSLARGRAALGRCSPTSQPSGVADPEPRYNLTWMDRLNLENLILVSRAICAAAEARRDSRGAHFREDFPDTSDLAASRYTVARLARRPNRRRQASPSYSPACGPAKPCCGSRRIELSSPPADDHSSVCR